MGVVAGQPILAQRTLAVLRGYVEFLLDFLIENENGEVPYHKSICVPRKLVL